MIKKALFTAVVLATSFVNTSQARPRVYRVLEEVAIASAVAQVIVNGPQPCYPPIRYAEPYYVPSARYVEPCYVPSARYVDPCYVPQRVVVVARRGYCH